MTAKEFDNIYTSISGKVREMSERERILNLIPVLVTEHNRLKTDIEAIRYLQYLYQEEGGVEQFLTFLLAREEIYRRAETDDIE